MAKNNAEIQLLQSEEARQTLADIYHYSEKQWGKTRAKHYLRDLLDAFDKIATSPHLGYAHHDIAQNYRLFPIGSHLIVYRFSPPFLFIVAVMHKSMDIGARLLTITETYH